MDPRTASAAKEERTFQADGAQPVSRTAPSKARPVAVVPATAGVATSRDSSAWPIASGPHA